MQGKRKWILLWLCMAGVIFSASAQEAQEADATEEEEEIVVERLKYKQQPGLALAASKIFFSDKRYAISGFGELNYVNYQGAKSTEGDIELYYTHLYRFATFLGYRFNKKIIWNSELQVEYVHDGNREGHAEFVLEAFLDFLLADYFKARIGFYPLTIGYVNNNDEPIMFYSVNRSEVERLITPTTWIEFGTMFYGDITNGLSYSLGISQGLNAENYRSGTWLRQGREIRLDVPQSISLNPQLNYTAIPNLTLSLSGYFGNSGQGNTIEREGIVEEVKAPIRLGTGYLKYTWNNFRFVTVGTYGRLGETDKIHTLTQETQGTGQVLGSQTYGYLFELGFDLLPYIRGEHTAGAKSAWFYDTHEMKLPLFIRYERLNTHYGVATALNSLPRMQNDLEIVTLGANFNTRENIVFKANYQFRANRYSAAEAPPESNRLEFGFGFIF